MELTEALAASLRTGLEAEYAAREKSRAAEAAGLLSDLARQQRDLAESRSAMEAQRDKAIAEQLEKHRRESEARRQSERNAEQLDRARAVEEARKATLAEADGRIALVQADLDRREAEVTALKAAQAALDARARALTDGEASMAKNAVRAAEAEREKIRAEEAARAGESASVEKQNLQRALDDVTRCREEAEGRERQLLERQGEVEEKERNHELLVLRRIEEERTRDRKARALQEAEDRARREAETARLLEEQRIELEDRHALAIQKKEIEKERMEERLRQATSAGGVGSQELQGEAMEAIVKRRISRVARLDDVDDVEKGARGADLIHLVRNGRGETVGKILWEMKDVKNWNEKWIEKILGDQRAAGADLAVIVTMALPPGIEQACHRNDCVWVASLPSVESLCLGLRMLLVTQAEERSNNCGLSAKMEAVYRLLTSAEFKLQTQTIHATFDSMQQQLDKEIDAMARIHGRRRKELDRLRATNLAMITGVEFVTGAALLEEDAVAQLAHLGDFDGQDIDDADEPGPANGQALPTAPKTRRLPPPIPSSLLSD